MSRKPSTIAVLDVGDCNNYASQQLAGRFSTRRLGGQSLAQRIARRLSDSAILDRVFVTGTNLPAQLVAGLGVEVLDLPYDHVCERLAATADSANADWVVYVPGNRPFIDPALVDCLLTRAHLLDSEVDYVGFCGLDGNWQKLSKLGVTGEVCHADALRRLRRNIDRFGSTTEELSLADWFTGAPGIYQLKFVSLPQQLDCHDLRFSIEDESDWELIELLSDHVGDELTEWQTLTDLVRHNASIRGLMAEKNGVGAS